MQEVDIRSGAEGSRTCRSKRVDQRSRGNKRRDCRRKKSQMHSAEFCDAGSPESKRNKGRLYTDILPAETVILRECALDSQASVSNDALGYLPLLVAWSKINTLLMVGEYKAAGEVF